MEKFGYGREMASEVAFGSFGHTLTTPGDQSILGETGVRVFDLDVGELNSAVGKLVNKVYQFTLCLD